VRLVLKELSLMQQTKNVIPAPLAVKPVMIILPPRVTPALMDISLMPLPRLVQNALLPVPPALL